jgi:peptidoglycan biosynthesis protein MviN/MurJ (putative lipid II flippase)
MSKQLKTFFTFWAIWFAASLLNGLSSGICIAIFKKQGFGADAGSIGLALICSFIFSVPFVVVVWVVASVAIASGKKEDALFQTILGASLILGMVGAMFFILTFGSGEFKESRYAVGTCIVVSAMAAVLLFRKTLKSDA